MVNSRINYNVFKDVNEYLNVRIFSFHVNIGIRFLNWNTEQSRFFFTSPLTPADNFSEPPAIPLTCPSWFVADPRWYIELPV